MSLILRDWDNRLHDYLRLSDVVRKLGGSPQKMTVADLKGIITFLKDSFRINHKIMAQKKDDLLRALSFYLVEMHNQVPASNPVILQLIQGLNLLVAQGGTHSFNTLSSAASPSRGTSSDLELNILTPHQAPSSSSSSRPPVPASMSGPNLPSVGMKRPYPFTNAASPASPALKRPVTVSPFRISDVEKDSIDSHSNPFFIELDRLHVEKVVKVGVMRIDMAISAEMLQAVRTKGGKVFVRKHFFPVTMADPHGSRDLQWEDTEKVTVGNHIIHQPKKKLRIPKNVAFFATPPPIDITHCILSPGRVPLILEFHSRDYINNLLIVIQAVYPNPLENLVARVTQQSSLQKTQSNSDDDLVELFRTVCLRCPLSGMRIERPVRSVSCHHDQCFDLETYLMFCKQQNVWCCPICSIAAPLHKLFEDNFFNTILDRYKDTEDDDLKIIINADYSFHMEDPKNPAASSSSNLPVSSSLNGSTSGPGENNNEGQKRNKKSLNERTCADEVLLISDDEDDLPSAPPPRPLPSRPLSPDPLAFSAIFNTSYDLTGSSYDPHLSSSNPPSFFGQQNGSHQNGSHPNEPHGNGSHPNGSHQSGSHSNGLPPLRDEDVVMGSSSSWPSAFPGSTTGSGPTSTTGQGQGMGQGFGTGAPLSGGLGSSLGLDLTVPPSGFGQGQPQGQDQGQSQGQGQGQEQPQPIERSGSGTERRFNLNFTVMSPRPRSTPSPSSSSSSSTSSSSLSSSLSSSGSTSASLSSSGSTSTNPPPSGSAPGQGEGQNPPPSSSSSLTNPATTSSPIILSTPPASSGNTPTTKTSAGISTPQTASANTNNTNNNNNANTSMRGSVGSGSGVSGSEEGSERSDRSPVLCLSDSDLDYYSSSPSSPSLSPIVIDLVDDD